MSKPQRKKLFIDAGVQGTILRRIVLYAVSCCLFVITPLFIMRALETPSGELLRSFGELLRHYGFLLGIVAVLLPLIVYDMLRLTNRLVGPVFRTRRELSRLVAGEDVAPCEFRDGDFWPELASLINQLSEKTNREESRFDRLQQPESMMGADLDHVAACR